MNGTSNTFRRIISHCRLESRTCLANRTYSSKSSRIKISIRSTHHVVNKLAHPHPNINTNLKYARHLSNGQSQNYVHAGGKTWEQPIAPSEKEQQIIDKTKEILYNIDLGSMTVQQVSDAKSLIFLYARRHTIEAAEISEQILERLITEGRDGGNLVARVESKIYNFIIDAYGKSKTDEGPLKAEHILKTMHERYEAFHENGDNAVKPAMPDVSSYNNLLNAWCQSPCHEAVTKAEEILAFLESDETLYPDDVTYNIMMNTYANQVGEYGYSQKAEDILLLMTALQKDGNLSVNPNTMSFNIVLKAWKNCAGGVQSAQRAEDILRLMHKLYTDGHNDVQPDSISFQTVIHAYIRHAKQGKLPSDTLDRLEGVADLLLESRSDLARKKGLVLKTFNTILECIAKSDVDDASYRASRIFDKMVSARKSGASLDGPDNITYSFLMNSYLSDAATVNKARELVQNMFDGTAPILPTTRCINTLLHFHCKQNDVNSAEKLFQAMITSAEKKEMNTRPDVATYNMMANLYFHSKKKDSSDQILSILKQIERDFDAGIVSQLDSFIFDIVINKLLRFKKRGEAYDVLMEMIRRFDQGALKDLPKLILFNMVLSAFTKEKNKEAAKKAMKLLHLMESGGGNGRNCVPFPDTISYSHVLVALIRAADKNTAKQIVEIVDKIEQNENNQSSDAKLDNIVFETALLGLSDVHHADSKLADEMIERMSRLERNNHKTVRLNPKCLNLAIRSYRHDQNLAKGKIAAFEVHRYLRKCMHKYNKKEYSVLPSTVGFNTVLKCWTETRHWKAILEAEDIYETMERLTSENIEGVAPDSITCVTMLSIYMKQINRKKVQRKAQIFFNQLKICDLDTYTCNLMLSIFARSTIQGRLNKAQNLLEDMKENGLGNVTSYNTLLGMVASSSKETDSDETLERALRTFTEIPQKNEESFALAMKACNNLSYDKEGNELHLKRLFDDACEHGFLGRKTTSALRAGIPSRKRQEELLGLTLDKEGLRSHESQLLHVGSKIK